MDLPNEVGWQYIQDMQKEALLHTDQNRFMEFAAVKCGKGTSLASFGKNSNKFMENVYSHILDTKVSQQQATVQCQLLKREFIYHISYQLFAAMSQENSVYNYKRYGSRELLSPHPT